MRTAYALTGLLLLAAASAASVADVGFRYTLAPGEAVVLRINMTGDEWPSVQVAYRGCSDEDGRSPALATMRIARTLADASVTTLLEAPGSAARVSVEARDPFIGSPDPAIDEKASRIVERRCVDEVFTTSWPGPKSETRIFQNTVGTGTLSLFVHSTPGVLSLDAVRVAGTVYDHDDARSGLNLGAQAHTEEVIVGAARIDLDTNRSHIGWFAPDRAGISADVPLPCLSSPGSCDDTICWTIRRGGRCDLNERDIWTFRNDGALHWQLTDAIGASATKAHGAIAGWIDLPDETYLRLDRAPPVSNVTFTGDVAPSGSFYTPITVTIDAEDDLSGVDRIDARRSGGTSFPYAGPFALGGTGLQCVQHWSTDREGNAEPSRSRCAFLEERPT